jgi:hypothetical protein
MDHDAGWAARQITLTSVDADGHSADLTLPCRWVEYIQTWDGDAPPFFIVHVSHTDRLGTADWQSLAFEDRSGKSHSYFIRDAREIRPNVVRLTKVD